jgi:hypothetical protein
VSEYSAGLVALAAIKITIGKQECHSAHLFGKGPVLIKKQCRRTNMKQAPSLLVMAPDEITGVAYDSNPSEKQENDNDEKDQSQAAARGVTPTPAMRPPWQGT